MPEPYGQTRFRMKMATNRTRNLTSVFLPFDMFPSAEVWSRPQRTAKMIAAVAMAWGISSNIVFLSQVLLRAVQRQLEGLVRGNADPNAEVLRVGRKKYKAVKPAIAQAVNDAAAKIVEEAATKLLRSAGNSKKRQVSRSDLHPLKVVCQRNRSKA